LEEDIETWPRGVGLDLIYHVVKFAAQRFAANFGDPIVVKVRFEIVEVKQRSRNVFQLSGSLAVSKKSAENFQLLWSIWMNLEVEVAEQPFGKFWLHTVF
jgi:hypothetical protein